MKCSSRRNCDGNLNAVEPVLLIASMKCSSRKNCDRGVVTSRFRRWTGLNEVQFPKELRRPGTPHSPACPGLNEVQFPKELRRGEGGREVLGLDASMKCSSRKNCDWVWWFSWWFGVGLNEVQFPKELRPAQAHQSAS